MANTTDTGNQYRDAIAALLSAAGFQCRTEVLLGSKKVDLVAKKRTQIEGEQTLLIETKCYTGTLDKDECIKFGYEYRQLIEKGHGDRAWLVSNSDISAAGKTLLDGDKRLSSFTTRELQRRLFNAEGYLQELIDQYERDEVEKFYIQPHTKNNEKLLDVVLSWVEESSSEPLAIIGGYGIGKSTFARAIAVKFARDALKSPTHRIPLLVPLGEVFDNQNIEGLMGKVFASQHRIEGYFYPLFETLNASGQFLIIFDGFDEMKHGMTIARFERNVSELMRLDKASAKLLVLGRDTAFQTDVEFRSIIQGQSRRRLGI